MKGKIWWGGKVLLGQCKSQQPDLYLHLILMEKQMHMETSVLWVTEDSHWTPIVQINETNVSLWYLYSQNERTRDFKASDWLYFYSLIILFGFL